MEKHGAVGLALFSSLFVLNCGNAKLPATPKDAADKYVNQAQSGDVKAVEALSTERYRRRAKKEVGRFQEFSKCVLEKTETEKESEGEWHIFHFQCEQKGGERENVIVAVIEEDGKFLVGDVD